MLTARGVHVSRILGCGLRRARWNKGPFSRMGAPPNGSPLFLITGFTSSSRVRAGNVPQRRLLYHRFFRTRFRGILWIKREHLAPATDFASGAEGFQV